MPPATAFDRLASWRPSDGLPRLRTIDAHTGGEPLRVIVGGVPEVPGATILERRRFMREHLDWIRTALMHEPRGHREMYGCLVLPPVRPDSHVGVLFMHNEGYSTMCGHGIIAMATVAVETGLVPTAGPATEIRIDTPAGLVVASVDTSAPARPRRVSFRNVPSFVAARDAEVDVPGWGRVRYDLAFGGAFYAYVDATTIGLRCLPEEHQRLIDAGMAIKRAVMAAGPIPHPEEPDLGYLYGTILIAPPRRADAHSRNVCIFADGQVDRSPTGTGVSGRMAIHHARGDVGIGDPLIIESLVDSRFTGRVLETTTVGPYPAVVPEVSGHAFITGVQEWVIDPADPLGRGFFLG